MKFQRRNSGFTLIELLAVITIIGIIAAVVAPSLKNFRKGDAMAAATRQMLDAVARARQLAISQRTTVYMVFVPPNFWDNSLYPNVNAFNALTSAEKLRATNLLDKQLTGYTFISLRTVGDQPGRGTIRYLSAWQTLPESCYIPIWKFELPNNGVRRIVDPGNGQYFDIGGFGSGNNLPFPSQDAKTSPKPFLPYIAFDFQGRLISGRDEFIPLTHGSVIYARDQNRALQLAPPSVQESPEGASTNSYNIIHIDWLTGRARLIRREVQ